MSETHTTAVAIVGMACRFPGARNKDEFWRNLIAGRCSIEDVDLDVAAREVSSLGRADNYVAKHATLPDPDHFDADFFGFTARQAAITDPQQRVFLEVAWHSLEDAGWRHDRQRNVGVFVGANLSSHLTNSISSDLDRHLPADFIGKLVGNDKDYISLMTSYLLDLSGPSFGVQSACSSSLLAVSLAYQNLLTFQCDMALAGGVSVRVPFAHGYVYQEGNAFSRNGSCRPFDSQACGTVFGSGAGAVVLKRLQDAMEDGDRIYALIRGAGVTNDGRAKAGFTAPSVEGQRAAIEIAFECAGIDPAQFGYIETHGTATPLGDPIEFEALRLALGERGYRCALGAVKGNVGHLDSASGIAGLIKATLAIRQGVIPPTLGFAEPNRAIALDEQSRFYVNTSPAEWHDGAARIAGVSSFGFGGTNVHLVLGGASHLQKEGGKVGQSVAPQTSQHLLCVSAKTAGALKRLAKSYAILLDDASLDVNELCDGALLHRNALPHRLAVSGTNAAMLKAGLSDEEGARATTYRSHGAVGKTGSRLAFLFGGQGLQEVGLGRELFAHDEVFRGAMDRCAALIMQAGGEDPRKLLYGASATNSDLALTRNTQPAMFALGYSLAAALESRSVIAHGMMGHSVGEITAACRAGWISLESAARLIVERSRIMDVAQKGGMLAVLASHEWVAELINKRQIPLSIAVVNGPQETVVAGSFEAVQQFAKHANSLGRSTKTLPVSHAFHSQLMEEAAVELGAIVLPPSISSGVVPVISNVTGAFYREAPDAGYWSTHIRSTVQFKAGLETLNRSGCDCFVEIGGTGQLSRMARATLGESISTTTLLTTRTAADESFCRALADLFCLGQDISPAKAKVPQVSLPLYPFEPTKHQYIRASTSAQPIHDCNVCGEGALIDRELDLPASGEARFVGSVSLASHRHFEDHRIGESVIVPGAAFLSTFVDAWTRCRSPEGDIVLTDVQFPEGMLLSADESRLVHLVMDRRSDEPRLCSLLSRATQMPKEGPWQLHARALASPPRSHNWARHSLTEAEADCRERVPGDEFYRAFRNAGYHLGSSFSWIDSIAIGNHIGVASIRAPSGRSSQEVLTCIIDSCFHVVHACRGVSVDRLAYDDDLYIPFSINQFSLRSPHLSGEVFHCIVRMRENSPSTEISADLTLIDGSGKALMEIEGFVARTVDRRLLGRTSHQEFSHFSQVVWVPQDQGTRSVEPAGDSWLVFGGKAALCFDLGEALSQHGRSPVFITEGSKFAKLNNNSFEVRLDECGDFSAVLASLRNQGRRVEGAVHCLALDTSQADLEGARQFTRLRQVTLDSAVALSQALLLDCDAAKPPKLAFITRNAVATGLRDNDRIVPQAASLMGFARSISLEHAELGGICLDLGAEGSYSVDDVVKELLSPGLHRQVAYRDGRRLVAELNGSVRPANGQRPALNGRWVITGGAGSIGLALAQCLASLGAKHIALLGRTAETSESFRVATTALTMQGCKVSFHAVDVTHRNALGVCLEDICLDGAGLEGLIHCAGVIDDRIVENLDRDSIASVFDPKVEGAWNLHDALRGVPVANFFVCSSAAGVVGAAGQSHYAAASAAVDALMTYRSATGQRSTSIVWGPWIDSSMFAALTDAQRRYLERQGHRLLTTEEAVGAFCDLLRTDNAQVGAFDIAAEKFIAAHAGADEGFFRRLAGKSRHNNGFEKRQRQAIDSESQLLATLMRNVEQAVGIALDPESAASRSPVDLGLVSLTAIEVREQFRAETRQDVPISWLLSGETMRELAQRIWSSTRQKHEQHEDQIKRVVV